MFDSRAARLQQQAIEALSDLRTWIWGQHAALLPDDIAAITHDEAERYAAYLDWYSRVEEVILALAAAQPAPSVAAAPAVSDAPAPFQPVPARAVSDAQLNTPTVRAPGSFVWAERAQGWQRMISVLAAEPAAQPPGAAGFKAA